MAEIKTKRMHPVEIEMSAHDVDCIEIKQEFNGEEQSIVLTAEQLPFVAQWLHDMSRALLNKKGGNSQ